MNYQKQNKKANIHSINAAALQQNIMKNFNLPSLSLNRNTNIHRTNSVKKKLDPLAKKIEKASKNLNQHEKEMFDYNKKLSLAQKLGLVSAPEKPLTSNIEEISLQRNDVCPICIEPFKTRDQIILSCSHVFHKQCLSSFEKHTNKQQCPICRKIDYQKKIHDKGFQKLQYNSALLIQKSFRGYVQRKYFFKHVLIPIRDKLTSTLLRQLFLNRRKIILFKMSTLGQKVTKSVAQKTKKTKLVIEQLNLNQLNENLEKNLFLIQHNLVKNHDQISNAIYKQLQEHPENIDLKWIKIKDVILQFQQYMKRNEKDCAICLQEMDGKKPQYLLSCSHSFHVSCLNSFNILDIGQQHTCPVCRQAYEKMFLVNKQ